MAHADIQVALAGNKGRAVESANGGRRTMYATQDEAIQASTERVSADKVELLIHGRGGRIRERNSFGHDPRDIKS